MKAGVYRHYKGGLYWVLGLARHSESGEKMVVYVRLYSRQGIPMNVRPFEEFVGSVVAQDGSVESRFEYVGDVDPG